MTLPKNLSNHARILEKVRHAQAMVVAMPQSGIAHLPDTRWTIGVEAIVSLIIAYNLLGEATEMEAITLAIASDTSRKSPPTMMNGLGTRIPAGLINPDCLAIANYDRSVQDYFATILGLLLDPYFYQRTRDGEKPLHEAALWGQRKAAYLLLDLIEHFIHVPDRIKGSLSY